MMEHFDTVMSFAVVMLLLSLLVTTFVQTLIAATGLRGRVLKIGLERLLLQISPELSKSHASKIADAVLRHAMIQHVRGRPATSIRKEELIRLLDDLAQRGSALLPADAQAELKTIMGTGPTPELAAATKDLKAKLETAFPAAASQVHHIVAGALVESRKVVADADVWFNTVMDRTTENFLAKTRWITGGVALILAFFLHVDSLSLIRQLASQPEVRAKLLQNVDATLQKAENTFARTAGEKALASASLEAARADLAADPDASRITNFPVNLITRAEGEAWLNTEFRNSTHRAAILDAYGKRFEEKTKIWLGELRQSADEINTSLANSGLAIIPRPTPPWSDYCDKPGHFWGTLMTVIFLSLGAPFWYNALRQLANLRPAVAEKIEPKSRSKR